MAVWLKDNTPSQVPRRLALLAAAGSIAAWWYWPRIWPEINRRIPPQIRKFQIVASPHGMFYVDGTANGRPLRMLVDSGSTMTAIPKTIAHNLGIDTSTLVYSSP